MIIRNSVSELGAGAGDQHRSAPATSGTLAELLIFKNRGKRWIELFFFIFNFKKLLLPRTRALVSLWFSLFSLWTRCWTSVIFLTLFLLATLFPVARALSASAHNVGICFHSIQSLFDLSRVQCSSQCLFSLQFRHIRLIVSYLINFLVKVKHNFNV